MWSVDRWLARIDQSSSRSFTERNSKYIERIIRNPRAMRHEAIDSKEKTLIDRGMCPKSFLSRKCRSYRGAQDERDYNLSAVRRADLLIRSQRPRMLLGQELAHAPTPLVLSRSLGLDLSHRIPALCMRLFTEVLEDLNRREWPALLYAPHNEKAE